MSAWHFPHIALPTACPQPTKADIWVAEIGSGDELSKRIYASYQQFLGLIKNWSDIADGAVLLSRRLA
jgi:hypothetical protein